MDSKKVKVDLIQHSVMSANLFACNFATLLFDCISKPLDFKPGVEIRNYFNSVLKENSGLYIEDDRLVFPSTIDNSNDKLTFLKMCLGVFLRQVYHMCMYVEYHRDDLSDLQPFERFYLSNFLTSLGLKFSSSKDGKLIIVQSKK